MLKKSSILFSRNNVFLNHQPSSTSKTSPPHAAGHRPQQQCRSYAMVRDGHSGHNHGSHSWPEVTSANTIPSPYQIFNQKKGIPYSKRRFYELVKIYHPDRHDHDSVGDGLSHAIKLERYRLIVAANNILSDPVKRGAYDCYGAGWNGQPDVLSPREASEGWGGYNGRGWGGGPGGPSQNATWEDWERWYQRDAKGKQEPRFVSNSAFVSLIVLFAALGGIGQATRVGNSTTTFIEQRDILHSNISEDLKRRRKETSAFQTRDERIQSFLKQRDLHGYGGMNPSEEAYRKLLPAPEVCSSQEIKQQPTDIHQSRKEAPKYG